MIPVNTYYVPVVRTADSKVSMPWAWPPRRTQLARITEVTLRLDRYSNRGPRVLLGPIVGVVIKCDGNMRIVVHMTYIGAYIIEFWK